MATQNSIENPAPPSLPLATTEYERRYQDQYSNVLRLYFNRLQNTLSTLFDRLGGRFLNFPYGAFQSNTTQTVAAINTPTLIYLEVTDFANGMYREENDGIHVEYAGIYNVQFSAQATNSDTQAHDAAIWLRLNGVDYPYSNSVFTITGTHGGQPGYNIVAANFYMALNKGDYVELWWSTNSLQLELNTLPPITVPFVTPGAPAVVATLSFVSNLPS